MSDENFDRFIDNENRQESIERAARAQGLEGVNDNRGRNWRNPLGLCGTCTNATIFTRGQVEHQETTIVCRVLDKLMKPGIVECSSYWKEGQMTLRDMGEIAWVIDPREGINPKSYA